MYPETLSHILVFKTDIRVADVEKLHAILGTLPGVRQWNVDCQDIDHVLRVESDDVTPVEIIRHLKDAGFFCEELPD